MSNEEIKTINTNELATPKPADAVVGGKTEATAPDTSGKGHGQNVERGDPDLAVDLRSPKFGVDREEQEV